jgi:hypothetical protein
MQWVPTANNNLKGLAATFVTWSLLPHCNNETPLYSSSIIRYAGNDDNDPTVLADCYRRKF